MELVHKETVGAPSSDPTWYVLSDETVDRMGDVIEAAGWKLAQFKKNPIALFNHKSDFPIGFWSDVQIKGKQLIGRLTLMPFGVSERLNEIRAAVDAGILRAVSVGFRASKADPIANGGLKFTEQELLECSVVSIPANPNALQMAKSLNLSEEVQEVIFGKSAVELAALRRSGEDAVTTKKDGASGTDRNKGKTKMPTLAERIETHEKELNELRDKLNDHMNGDDIDGGVVEEISSELETKQASLASLRRAEVALGSKGADVSNKGENQSLSNRRPAAAAATKVKPEDYALRSAVVAVLSHVTKEAPQQIIHRAYGDDESTKIVFENFSKAASAPATISQSGWASQLVQTVNADFMSTLLPASVYPELSRRGLRLNFGRNGVISIPSRSATPTVAGAFVGEGAPIPVRQGAFTSQALTPKKMAVISTFTREIASHSIPAIEGLIRDAIQEDTGVAIDTVLMDAIAASAIRPAGLRAGVTLTTATAGGGMAALVGDVKALVGALIQATNGNVRAPVWIMNPAQALAISLTANAGGDFVFADQMNAGNLMGYPVIQSPTVPAGTLTLVDAADFVSVEGDDPTFDVSDQATLHMEDTAPAAISATGTPNTVAAPIRSLWQTDSIALRMILPMNWALRRAGVVAGTSGVTW